VQKTREAFRRVGQGRPAVTSRDELSAVALDLFAARGFEQTTLDDLAEAAGIGRRTFFRYFASKNDVVYGDFEAALEDLRARLAATPADTPLVDGIREAVLAFNALPVDAEPQHRVRMALVLHTPALQAHSTLRYAGWRSVIAAHVAERTGEPVEAMGPQLVAHLSLACAVTAYEQWLNHPGSDLQQLLDTAFRGLSDL
jgi:TetR/AcrR family transcriptional regulator, regulator of mycofactocin system